MFFLLLSLGIVSIGRTDGSTYFFSDGPISTIRDTQVGSIDIGDSLYVSLDLVLNSGFKGDWSNVLHVGSENQKRSPGIWIRPRSNKLHVIMSDQENWNTHYDIVDTLDVGTVYNIKLIVSEGTVSSYLDGVLQNSRSNIDIAQRTDEPIYISDPWYEAADVTVSNLVINPYIKLPTLEGLGFILDSAHYNQVNNVFCYDRYVDCPYFAQVGNVYCLAVDSCYGSTLSQIYGDIVVTASQSLDYSDIDQVDGSIYIDGSFCGVQTEISNVAGDIIASGESVLDGAQIQNVEGKIVGYGNGIFWYASIRGVDRIDVEAEWGLEQATITSDVGEGNYFVLNVNLGTVTVRGSYSFVCSEGNTCYINCLGAASCDQAQFDCRLGSCTMYCGVGVNGDTCPPEANVQGDILFVDYLLTGTNDPTGTSMPTASPVCSTDRYESCTIPGVQLCDSDNCSDTGENPECVNDLSWGCQECGAGFFAVAADVPCVACSNIDGCDECMDGIGCSVCGSGYSTDWDPNCYLRICTPSP